MRVFWRFPPIHPTHSSNSSQDFGDVVVHVLTAEQRERYNLESFYGAAEEVDLPFAVGGGSGEEGGAEGWSRTYGGAFAGLEQEEGSDVEEDEEEEDDLFDGQPIVLPKGL